MKKRKDGRYMSKIYLSISDGKPQYKYVYGSSPKEVEKKIKEIKSQLDRGLDPNRSYTFKECVDVLIKSKESSMQPYALKTLIFRLQPFLVLGDKELDKIQKSEIQPILDELSHNNPHTGKSSSHTTASRYLNACSQVFECGIENRWTDYNPCKYVSVPRGLGKRETRALSAEERKWIEETPHRAQTAAMLMLYSGLRKGEATALTWDDVDLKEHTILVNKSYDFKNCVVKTPKTKAGERIVSIPQILVDYLKKEPRTSKYVVHMKNNQKMTKGAWWRMWDSYMMDLDKKYGSGVKQKGAYVFSIEPFTIHELRHTFCTMMYFAGVDILTAKQQMGHSNINTTLGIYSHLDAQFKKKSISKLDAFLGVK